MATFMLEINCENAAFQDDCLAYELARILRALSEKVKHLDATDDKGVLRDENGNKVGEWVYGC